MNWALRPLGSLVPDAAAVVVVVVVVGGGGVVAVGTCAGRAWGRWEGVRLRRSLAARTAWRTTACTAGSS